jgi:putative oxidoreductase
MTYGILILRVALGAIIAGHGAQKLFGWFGGGGPSGTAAGFAHLRFRPPLLFALAAGLAELAGGAMLAVGLLTPLAALAITVVMLNAIATVHWRNGFWNTNGGYELNLLVLAGALAVAVSGPGRISLDNLIGWAGSISGLWWGLGVIGAAGVISAVTLIAGRHAEPQAPSAVEVVPAGPLKRAA